MNKLLIALFAGLFAASMSVGAFAADAAKPADKAAATAESATAKEKPAMPAAKKHVMHKHVAKAKAATSATPAAK